VEYDKQPDIEPLFCLSQERGSPSIYCDAHESAKRWLIIAIRDRCAAQSLFQAGHLENACRLIQQSAKSLLKSVILPNPHTRLDKHNSAYYESSLRVLFKKAKMGNYYMPLGDYEHASPDVLMPHPVTTDDFLYAAQCVEALYDDLVDYFGSDILGEAHQRSGVDNTFKVQDKTFGIQDRASPK